MVGAKRTYSGKGSNFKKDPAKEQEFEDEKRRYSYGIGFLLAKNVTQSSLLEYLHHPEQEGKFEALKRFR